MRQNTALDYAKPKSDVYTLLENHGATHSKEYQHLKALGTKVEDFDKEKLKIDGECYFYLLVNFCDLIFTKARKFFDTLFSISSSFYLAADEIIS